MSKRKLHWTRAASREAARLDRIAETLPPCIDELRSYWRDPAPFDAEIAENRRMVNAAIDAGMAGLNAKQVARWAAEVEA